MMASDKIRIKKYQQERVQGWANALEIPESKLVEDAVNFYLRYLEGKQQLPSTVSLQPAIKEIPQVFVEHDEEDTSDGGLDLDS